jgi:hypothetical protein
VIFRISALNYVEWYIAQYIFVINRGRRAFYCACFKEIRRKKSHQAFNLSPLVEQIQRILAMVHLNHQILLLDYFSASTNQMEYDNSVELVLNN